jgi:two-component system, cell cycle sensor histidine kinase and response regulator CckA
VNQPEGSAAELQAFLDATMDVVAVFDSSRRFVLVNDAACAFYGRPREELVGARLDDFIGSNRAEADWTGFLEPERIAQGMVEDVWDGEQDGSRLVLEVRATPEFLPGRHLFVLRDITARRELEDRLRQSQKMEAIGQLAGGVAHDFNNLLTVISGYAHMARRHVGVGPGSPELGEIVRAADRAAELTRQLLAFARQQVLAPAPLDLNEVARGLVPMLGRLIGEDVRIAMLAGPGLPRVLADRAQVEQVIINLAINARDAMPDGGTLSIETSASVLDEHVCLSVTDTGTGIEPAVLERIFEPFYTTKEIGLGTGLGLATVHGIVTQSGGHVRVSSEPGHGSTFSVHLPAVAPGVGMASADAPEVSSERLGGDETILLCEDDESVCRLAVLFLAAEGYTVISCATPSEALAAASARGPIHALVTDIVMPEMSGVELARRLGLPALFVSGYSEERVEPGTPFLEKPFDRTGLLRAVRGVLDTTQSRA